MDFQRTLKRGSRGSDVKAVQNALHCYPDGFFGNLTEEAVREFQMQKGLVVDGVVGQKTWSALFGGQSLKKSRRAINLIVVHCTATIEGRDYSVSEVRRWHLKRGFSDIGYHYLIGIDGKVHEGRSVDVSGAHTAGYNANSIGVCYVGGLDASGKAKDTRTPAQKAALLRLLKELKTRFPKATIHGHREFARKDCPCFNAYEEYKAL